MNFLLFSIALLSVANISKAMEEIKIGGNGNPLGRSCVIVWGDSDDEKQPCVQNEDPYYRRKGNSRDYVFNSVATIMVGTSNKELVRVQNLSSHVNFPLFIQQAEGKPYSRSNGGLIYPFLKEYNVVYTPIKDQEKNSFGMKIEAQGTVCANGIAAYEFGRADNSAFSALEKALLGFIKEREIGEEFANEFLDCIKNEWTSKKAIDNAGMRTLREKELMQRHMNLGEYDDNLRMGERIRLDYLGGYIKIFTLQLR